MKTKQSCLQVKGELLWTGIRKATARSKEPVLCLIEPDTFRLVALCGLQLVVSWEAELQQRLVPARVAFLVPPVVAQLLCSDAVRSQEMVEIAIKDEDVVARLTDHLGQYEIRWRSGLASFPAPVEFSELIKVPEALMEVPYLRITDTTHEAVAKLVHMEADPKIHRAKLAILIDLNFGRLSVDGREIVSTESSRYYFNPRLVIRALEFIKEQTVGVGVTPLRDRQRAYLSLLAKQGGWTVHCALLSIGKDTQSLYPLPPKQGQ